MSKTSKNFRCFRSIDPMKAKSNLCHIRHRFNSAQRFALAERDRLAVEILRAHKFKVFLCANGMWEFRNAEYLHVAQNDDRVLTMRALMDSWDAVLGLTGSPVKISLDLDDGNLIMRTTDW